MSRNKFVNMIKNKLSENALEYLLKKQGSKGKEIKYESLEMAEYLLPFNNQLSIGEKQSMFAIRNRMVEIGDNFGEVEKCHCGIKENMLHIYNCEYLNKNEIETSYENIHNGNRFEQIKVFRRLKQT